MAHIQAAAGQKNVRIRDIVAKFFRQPKQQTPQQMRHVAKKIAAYWDK